MTEEPPSRDTGLEEQVKEAVRISKFVPAESRKMALELLLKLTCSSNTYKGSLPNVGDIDNGYKMPTPVAVFLDQFQIPRSNIKEHFVITGPREIARKYKIRNKMLSRSQIQFACMLALEHALYDGSFEFSFERVRTVCKDNDCLNHRTFMRTFRIKSKLFKSLDNKDSIVLSPLGKEYLARLLIKLSNKS